MKNPNDIYPVSDKPVFCSGKRGPHDLRQVGQKRMPNGRLSCRACYRQSRTETKRKAREAKGTERREARRLYKLSLDLPTRVRKEQEKLRRIGKDAPADELNPQIEIVNALMKECHDLGIRGSQWDWRGW